MLARVTRAAGANKMFCFSIALDLWGTLLLAFSLQVLPSSAAYAVHSELGGKEILYPVIDQFHFYSGLALLAIGTLLNAADRLWRHEPVSATPAGPTREDRAQFGTRFWDGVNDFIENAIRPLGRIHPVLQQVAGIFLALTILGGFYWALFQLIKIGWRLLWS